MIYNRVWEHCKKFEADHNVNITMAQLAEIAGVSRPSMIRILHNETQFYNMDDMERLCRFLGVGIEAMFYMTDQPPDTASSSTKRKYERKNKSAE